MDSVPDTKYIAISKAFFENLKEKPLKKQSIKPRYIKTIKSVEKVYTTTNSNNNATSNLPSNLSRASRNFLSQDLSDNMSVLHSENQRLKHSNSRSKIIMPGIKQVSPLISLESEQYKKDYLLLSSITSPIITKVTKAFKQCYPCLQCKGLKDPKFDKYMGLITESKSIIARSFRSILEGDLVGFTQDAGLIEESLLEKLLLDRSKQPSTRLAYRTVSLLLNDLIDGKTGLMDLIPNELASQFEYNLFAKGKAFEEVNKLIIYDDELEPEFDNKTKNLLKVLFNEKDNKEISYIGNFSKRISTLRTKHQDIPSIGLFSPQEIEKFQKKNLFLFLVFLEILSEIYQDCKERATLLYKVFKQYFVQQEKKYLYDIQNLKSKLKFYKELFNSQNRESKMKFRENLNISNILSADQKKKKKKKKKK